MSMTIKSLLSINFYIMETSTIITGLVAILLIFGPFYMLAKSGGKQKKLLVKQFKELASRLGLNITDFDNWNDMAFGIDKEARKVLFYKNRKGVEEHVLIELDSVVQCKKINVSRTLKSKGEMANVIDFLGLEFVLKNNMAPVRIEFYSSDNSFVLQEELQLVQKWSTMIEGMLKGVKVPA